MSYIKQLQKNLHYADVNTLESDKDFCDDFRDNFLGGKRLFTVGSKSIENTATNLKLKLYQKNDNGVFKMYKHLL